VSTVAAISFSNGDIDGEVGVGVGDIVGVARYNDDVAVGPASIITREPTDDDDDGMDVDMELEYAIAVVISRGALAGVAMVIDGRLPDDVNVVHVNWY
jgi:hypothetical protein